MSDRILNTAEQLFFQFGLSSVPMDDIARRCGISKKTLYLHFADRHSLIEAVVAGLIRRHIKAIGVCARESENAVEEMAVFIKVLLHTLAGINPTFFHQLECHFPLIWERFRQYVQKDFRQYITQNVKRGVQENLYIESAPTELVEDIRIQHFRTALNPAGFCDKHPVPAELIGSLAVFLLHAITTAKGRKLIPKYFNINERANTKK